MATLGPATEGEATLRAMLTAGANVVRLNFAHGEPDRHRRNCDRVRRVAAELGVNVGILVDLPGPKIRTGAFTNGAAELSVGGPFLLTTDEIEGDEDRASTSLNHLADLVAVGDEIFLADGEVVLRVERVEKGEVHTRVERGGVVRSRKGLHLPRAEKDLEAFTEQDRRALAFAVEMDCDLVGLSFVRNANDITTARAELPLNAVRPQLVAKIETASAAERIDEIVAEADAVMVARGDLGIQTPLSRVPLLQKKIIAACNRAGKPVITATEMLESMTENPLPSRAEVADVANAVFDGTDALMLSEETAVGRFPADAVTTMGAIALASEERGVTNRVEDLPSERTGDRVAWAVAHAAAEAAKDLGAAAILAVTATGSTARRVAAYRPDMRIAALVENEECLGALAVVWGVTAIPLPPGDDLVGRVVTAARAADLVATGDLVVVVAGTPGPRAGATDYLRVARA